MLPPLPHDDEPEKDCRSKQRIESHGKGTRSPSRCRCTPVLLEEGVEVDRRESLREHGSPGELLRDFEMWYEVIYRDGADEISRGSEIIGKGCLVSGVQDKISLEVLVVSHS